MLRPTLTTLGTAASIILGLAMSAEAQQLQASASTTWFGAHAAQAATRAVFRDPLGNLTAINRGTHRYRWSRSGLHIDLHDRHGRWTEAEAIMIRDALDRLPDLYIRKAILGGMRVSYRDGARPTAPWDGLVSPKDTLSAVAVPPDPWGFVAYGDRTFLDGRAVATVVHELGHCVQWGMSGWASLTSGTPGWTGISWTTGVPTLGMKSWNGFPSNYARTNHLEDFAEGAEFYWLAPGELQRANPAKYRFMRDTVFEGVQSPAEVRQEGKVAIDPVTPAVTRLGDASDDWGSVVQIYGERFMGPLDGGYNQVRFRGTRTLHVPVSRTHVYSWVPTISEGSAPITVRTQDGTSNGAAFRVEKPWWKFW